MVIKSVRRTLLATTIIAGSLAATPAFAQDAPAAEEESGVIVVTGTLIRNPNLTSSSPVNVVGEDEIALRVPNNAEEILRQLPGVSPGIGTPGQQRLERHQPARSSRSWPAAQHRAARRQPSRPLDRQRRG